MGKEMSRRSFLKSTAVGAAGAVAMGAINPLFSTAKAEETQEDSPILKPFAGVQNVRKIRPANCAV